MVLHQCFWVERPGILLSPPSLSGKEDKDDHTRRIETFNNITRILIVVAIVLLILRVRWWWILLVVGLAVIMFTYYNVTSPSKDVEDEGYTSVTERMNRKPSAVAQGYDDEDIISRKPREGTRITAKLTAPRRLINPAHGPILSAPRIPDEEWTKYVTFSDEEIPDMSNYVVSNIGNYIPVKETYKQPTDHLEMYRESMEEERAAMKTAEEIHDTTGATIMYAS